MAKSDEGVVATPAAGGATFRLEEGASFALPDGCTVTVHQGALKLSDGQRLPLPSAGGSVTIERRLQRPDGRWTRVRHTIRLADVLPPKDAPPAHGTPGAAPPADALPPDGAPTDTPPANAPSADAPHTDAPPADAPPAGAPPTDAPSADALPADAPPADAPLEDAPPADAPHTDALPADAPPTDAHSADTPSADAPSADALPADAPPADTPPADTPPADAPPADTPPADTPPADTPPTDAPSADAPSADAPPADAPPADDASADAPPADAPGGSCTADSPTEHGRSEADSGGAEEVLAPLARVGEDSPFLPAESQPSLFAREVGDPSFTSPEVSDTTLSKPETGVPSSPTLQDEVHDVPHESSASSSSEEVTSADEMQDVMKIAPQPETIPEVGPNAPCSEASDRKLALAPKDSSPLNTQDDDEEDSEKCNSQHSGATASGPHVDQPISLTHYIGIPQFPADLRGTEDEVVKRSSVTSPNESNELVPLSEPTNGEAGTAPGCRPKHTEEDQECGPSHGVEPVSGCGGTENGAGHGAPDEPIEDTPQALVEECESQPNATGQVADKSCEPVPARDGLSHDEAHPMEPEVLEQNPDFVKSKTSGPTTEPALNSSEKDFDTVARSHGETETDTSDPGERNGNFSKEMQEENKDVGDQNGRHWDDCQKPAKARSLTHQDSLHLPKYVPLSPTRSSARGKALPEANDPKSPERIDEDVGGKPSGNSVDVVLAPILKKPGYGVSSSDDANAASGNSLEKPEEVTSMQPKPSETAGEKLMSDLEEPEPVWVPKVVSFFESITPNRTKIAAERARMRRGGRSPAASPTRDDVLSPEPEPRRPAPQQEPTDKLSPRRVNFAKSAKRVYIGSNLEPDQMEDIAIPPQQVSPKHDRPPWAEIDYEGDETVVTCQPTRLAPVTVYSHPVFAGEPRANQVTSSETSEKPRANQVAPRETSEDPRKCAAEDLAASFVSDTPVSDQEKAAVADKSPAKEREEKPDAIEPCSAEEAASAGSSEGVERGADAPCAALAPVPNQNSGPASDLTFAESPLQPSYDHLDDVQPPHPQQVPTEDVAQALTSGGEPGDESRVGPTDPFLPKYSPADEETRDKPTSWTRECMDFCCCCWAP